MLFPIILDAWKKLIYRMKVRYVKVANCAEYTILGSATKGTAKCIFLSYPSSEHFTQLYEKLLGINIIISERMRIHGYGATGGTHQGLSSIIILPQVVTGKISYSMTPLGLIFVFPSIFRLKTINNSIPSNGGVCSQERPIMFRQIINAHILNKVVNADSLRGQWKNHWYYKYH